MRLYEFKEKELEELVRTILSMVNDVGSGHIAKKIIFGNAELEDNAEKFIGAAIARYVKEKFRNRNVHKKIYTKRRSNATRSQAQAERA